MKSEHIIRQLLSARVAIADIETALAEIDLPSLRKAEASLARAGADVVEALEQALLTASRDDLAGLIDVTTGRAA